MAYTKTKTGGELAVPATGTSASAVADFPNSGVSILTVSSTETFALAAPVAGIRKTIVVNQYSTAALPEIWASTAAGGTVTFMGVTTGFTKIKMSASRSTHAATVIELLGINSTRWAITNVFPVVTATSGGAVIGGAITLSS